MEKKKNIGFWKTGFPIAWGILGLYVTRFRTSSLGDNLNGLPHILLFRYYVVASFGHWLGCIPLLIDSSGHRQGPWTRWCPCPVARKPCPQLCPKALCPSPHCAAPVLSVKV
jgi:hypothetical protein